MIESTVLLLSDVVDSTQLAERLDMEQLARLWEAHDRAARSLLREWGGREIDKSDGFLLLFHRVDEALGFAEAYHQALARLAPPIKARVGIHIGEVMLRNNSPDEVALGAKLMEVEGPAKPLAARVMSLALGGQTLLSDGARAALGDTPHRLQSHGHWRLKGLQEPIELFEVGGVNAPFTPPPDAAKAYRVLRQGELWLPVRDLRHTLPAERDSFVGREPALQELAQRFDGGARLVSLLGIGGTGKTRLAQRFGWTWLGDFPGGVWFCDLSQATGIDGIVHAVAQGLELPLGKAEPVQQIGQAIAGRGACLVIVDNFEQVARHAEATVGQWLDRAADARFLVTSREVLGIVGEHAMPLPPLPVDDSVKLFMRRAIAATSSFKPVGDDAAAIEPLVKLLDGLPLAIELCAARARVMRPPMLLQRMSERFKLLTSSGGRHDRQATLRATLDWSWDLLTEPERSALAQLSVFEGGFTLEAAEAVIDLSAFDDAPWVVDVVQSLLQKSLVRQVSDRRFELLKSVQDYAAECGRRRVAGGESATGETASARARHWQYFAQLQGHSDPALRVETENLVVACRRAIERGVAESAVALLVNLSGPLRLTGPFSALHQLASEVAALPGLSDASRATACSIDGGTCFLLGRFDQAGARYLEGLGLARKSQDLRQEAELLRQHGELQHARGLLDDALADLIQAVQIGRDQGDLGIQFRALNALGALATDQSRLGDARAHYSVALQLALAEGDDRWIGGLHGNLGALCHEEGELDEAESHYAEALRLATATGDRLWAGNSGCNLGLLLFERDRIEEARSHYEEALVVARELGHQALEFTVLCNLGLACEAQGMMALAKQYYEVSVRLATEVGDTRIAARFRVYLARLHTKLGELECAASCLVASEISLRGIGDRLSRGLLQCAYAEHEWSTGRMSDAKQSLRHAQSIAEEVGVTANSELGRELLRVRSLIKQYQPTISQCS